ncbi:MAG: Unknown protein [uncultured Thiotrichaceae bacterium]|uniref:Uncharacterized protein n=1 Tax=uncultured Thiotrichaceae bacterium TaxID=298394 RepID=A0A6S6UC43_9GAMM|nr:MAG: Unknown protein [uncultured Thiotrichaceae bacterium]
MPDKTAISTIFEAGSLASLGQAQVLDIVRDLVKNRSKNNITNLQKIKRHNN